MSKEGEVMFIWLLVLLLLVGVMYILYKIKMKSSHNIHIKKEERHYTFKI